MFPFVYRKKVCLVEKKDSFGRLMWMLVSKDEAVWSTADVASSGSYIFWDRFGLLPKPMDGVKVLGGLSHRGRSFTQVEVEVKLHHLRQMMIVSDIKVKM